MLLIFIVVISGCAKQTVQATKAGLALSSFSPTLEKIGSTAPVEFTLIVKNTGEAKATNVTALLGGLPMADKWNLLSISPALDEDVKWQKALKNQPLAIALASELAGADPAVGFVGEEGTAVWRLKAPRQDTDQKYDVTVNLFYGYTTSASLLIKVVSLDYLLTLTEEKQKEAIKDMISVATTSGPISISLKTEEALISDVGTIPLVIEFTNVGGGRVFKGGYNTLSDIPKAQLGSVLDWISVEVPEKLKCQQKHQKIYDVRLIKDKGKLTCYFVVGGVQATTEEISIKATYRYFVEGKSSIRVTKQLYVPPIYDLSVEDSRYDITHVHGKTNEVKIIPTITNKGNQDIAGTFKLVPSVDNSKGESMIVLPQPLKPFDSASAKEIFFSIEIIDRIIVDVRTEPLKALAEEENVANNQLNPKSIQTILDYDISVEKIVASIEDPSKLSVKIIASVANIGKNVIGKEIPVKFLIDDKEFTCPETIITELEPGKSKDVSCLWDNLQQKQKFNIMVSVPYSQQETIDMKKRDTNNHRDYPFEINYDISLESASFDEKTSEFVAVVKNTGNIEVKGILVDFGEAGKLLCSKFEDIRIEPTKTVELRCSPSPLSPLDRSIKHTITAFAMGVFQEINRANNEREFTILGLIITLNSIGGDQAEPYETYIPWSGRYDLKFDFETNRKAECKVSIYDVSYDNMIYPPYPFFDCQDKGGSTSHICYATSIHSMIELAKTPYKGSFSIACKDEFGVKHSEKDNLDVKATIYLLDMELKLITFPEEIDPAKSLSDKIDSPTIQLAQNFTSLKKPVKLTKLGLYLTKVGNPDNLLIKLQQDATGKPYTEIDSTYIQIQDTGGWITAEFPRGITIDSNKKYWITASCECNSNNYYKWYGKEGGVYLKKTDTTWTDATGTLAYNVYGTIPEFTLSQSPWTSGIVSGALKFDSIDDYVLVSDSDSLDITDAFTFVVVTKIDSFDRPFGTGILSKVGAYYLSINNKGAVFLSIIPAIGEGAIAVESNDGEIQTGTWYKLAVTYDGSNLKFYKDSSEIKSPPLSKKIKTSANDLYISSSFESIIDEVRIYNRALSKSEITNVINVISGGGNDVRNGLVSEWKFNEGKGNIAKDTAGDNHGTIYG